MNSFNKILLFGDYYGVLQILKNIERNKIAAIIGPSIRLSELELLKKVSREMQIPIYVQPNYKSSNYNHFILNIKKLKYDSIISNSYSMIIRPDVLKYCNYNAVNIHWSLLPFNRGPNPMQWAIIKGERITGVTIHFIDDGIDTGDIIEQQIVKISHEDTWVTLKHKLKLASDSLIKNILPFLFEGKINRVKQNNLNATKNNRLDSDFPKIDFSLMDNLEIYNLIRAQVRPLKGAYIENGKEKIYFSDFIKISEINKIRIKYEK